MTRTVQFEPKFLPVILQMLWPGSPATLLLGRPANLNVDLPIEFVLKYINKQQNLKRGTLKYKRRRKKAGESKTKSGNRLGK